MNKETEPEFLIEKISKSPFLLHYNSFKNEVTELSKLYELFKDSVEMYEKEINKKIDSENTDSEEYKKKIAYIERTRKILNEETIWHYELNNDYVELLLKKPSGISLFKNNFITKIRELILIHLISQFEFLLECNLIFAFGNFPFMLKSKEQNLSYEEILTYKDIDELHQFLSRKIIRKILDGGIEKIHESLNEKYAIMDLKNNKNWKEFTERFYRRNLLIHNRLYINDTYRLKTGYQGEDVSLKIDEKYVFESIELFKNYAEFLHQGFIKKFYPMFEKQPNQGTS